MTIDVNKLITIAGLENFKTRQDAANDARLLKRSNVAMDGNEIALTVTEAAGSSSAVVLKALTSNSTVSASNISGVLSIENIPAAAQERVIPVANQAARYALTSADAQIGDVIHEQDTGLMFFVVDDTKLSQAAGYQEFTAGAASSVPWSGVTNKPETFTPSSHNHGNITNDGKIGSTANLPLITGTDGVVQAGSFGNAANTFCEGNDSRLSDSRDPNDHASNKVTAMTGYSKPASTAAIAATDSLNGAIGKLEKKADDIAANAGDMANYQKAASVSAVSTSDTVVDAIGKLEAAVDNVATNAEIDEEIFGITA